MTRSVEWQLILKDWKLQRWQVFASLAAGAIALGIVQIPGEVTSVIGIVWYFIALIVLGSTLPPSNIINERKKQHLPFLMSLPISPFQYARAKFVSTLGLYLIPWTTLLLAALVLLLRQHGRADGMIPALLVLSGVPLLGFCLGAGISIATESEPMTVAASGVCNSTYWLVWYLFIRDAGVRRDLGSPVPVWSPYILRFLTVEVVAIISILGIAFWLQSRKRNFL